MKTEVTSSYEAAAAFFAAMVSEIGPDQWDQPGIGEWSIRSLTGHGARSLSLLEQYVKPTGTPTATGIANAANAAGHGDAAAITARGVAAGVALGTDPAAAVADLAGRAVALVGAAGPDAVADTPFGVLSLEDYLRTRIVELVVHGIDLARAAGRPDPVPVPPAALRCALLRLVDNALDQGVAIPLVEALTGRAPLPTGFRAVP